MGLYFMENGAGPRPSAITYDRAGSAFAEADPAAIDFAGALAGARDAAIEGLIEAAKAMGANGVIGIDFDYEVLGETNGMMMVAVSGTAVKLG